MTGPRWAWHLSSTTLDAEQLKTLRKQLQKEAQPSLALLAMAAPHASSLLLYSYQNIPTLRDAFDKLAIQYATAILTGLGYEASDVNVSTQLISENDIKL
ncbi:hypothetical protein [Limnobacter sp.]|uniref:hypothetical protein n=1 Tax=Limnobacter sp. TaxID=2003368 RepID=UPI0025BB841A|nr:hypothetical protein [Limnobacter sp.]